MFGIQFRLGLGACDSVGVGDSPEIFGTAFVVGVVCDEAGIDEVLDSSAWRDAGAAWFCLVRVEEVGVEVFAVSFQLLHHLGIGGEDRIFFEEGGGGVKRCAGLRIDTDTCGHEPTGLGAKDAFCKS